MDRRDFLTTAGASLAAACAGLVSERAQAQGARQGGNRGYISGHFALELDGKKPKSERRAGVRQLAEVLHADMKPFEILLDIREDKSGVDAGGLADPGELFAQYLVCISRLITFVDGLDGQRG